MNPLYWAWIAILCIFSLWIVVRVAGYFFPSSPRDDRDDDYTEGQ